MKTWLLPTFIAMFCWGLWGFIPKITTRYVSPASALIYETIGVMVVGLSTLVFLRFRPDPDLRGMGLGIGTGILGMIGAFCYLVAVSRGKVSVISVMTAIYPVISVALAAMVLKEPVTLKEGLGMGFALLGIFLMAW
ncbi:MAG: DMT family transporter [Deltaproteobacteria bacterium]|nr:DMT family transporter [Deltaproteobacteria bacterium]